VSFFSIATIVVCKSSSIISLPFLFLTKINKIIYRQKLY
jgi:hypothetical protein